MHNHLATSAGASSSSHVKFNGETDGLEPIAIVGMGCRLPGGSSSPSKLWELLENGKSGQSQIPKSRFNIEGFYNPEGNTPGSVNTIGGYFIDDDIQLFDNDFFGINKIEASYMDPQQRKLLEVVYECLESSGISLEKVSGTNVGCYVGNFTYDFSIMQNRDSENLHRYSATGMGATILANRISHVFNLEGPSLALDTACSSSLYCLHIACAALNANECDAAIVASANLIQSPEQQLATAKVGVLSPTSTCHTFDASADGYGRGEGIGVLYLKRLSNAVRDGNPVRSIIRGTAVNSDGKTQGLTLPSASAQEKVIRKAYAKANLGFEDTDYVECHGTGTAVGDPIETEALSRVFKRPSTRPLLIGSVKPNIGHGEAVSGISSVIKTTLALENGKIPPTIGITKINPKIKLEEWNMRIVTDNTNWPYHGASQVRRASINAFGYGGANAHIILEAAGPYLPRHNQSLITKSIRTQFLLPFSANSKTSLEKTVSDLGQTHLESIHVADLAYTMTRRSQLSVRGYLQAGHLLTEDIRVDKLRSQAEKKDYSSLPVAFIFTGQGAQWPQMGFELLNEFPSFRRSIQELDAVLQLLPEAPSWTIEGVMSEPAETSSIHLASHSQPICTAIQIALVELLSKCGVKPEAVLGHSSGLSYFQTPIEYELIVAGEICAAFAAGYLSAKAAIIIAYYRGYVVSKFAPSGAMMAAGCNSQSALAYVDELGLRSSVSLACINSPESVTLSGDSPGIDQLLAHLQAKHIFARKLNTGDKAYHSYHMAILGQEYQDFLAIALPFFTHEEVSRCKWISSLTGEICLSSIDHSYWRENLQSPVLFSAAILQLYKESNFHIVELGPHPVLKLPIKQTITKTSTDEGYFRYSSALYRGKNSVSTVLDLLGELYLYGHNIDFKAINDAEPDSLGQPKSGQTVNIKVRGKQLTDLPNYPWHYTSTLWNESRLSKEFRNRQYPYHNLLGSQTPGGSGKIIQWRNILRTRDVPWLEGHKLDQSIVFPCTGYITMALEAICQATHTTKEELPSFELANIKILKALVLQDPNAHMGIEIFTTLQPQQISSIRRSNRWWLFEISSFEGGRVVNHANGLVSIDHSELPIDGCLDIPQNKMEQNAIRSWYDRFTKIGLNFDGSFKSLAEIGNARNKKSLQTIAKTKFLPGPEEDSQSQSNYIVHPATIDALLQAAFIASSAGVIKKLSAKVPVTIDNARFRIPSLSARSDLFTIQAASEFVGPGVIKYSAELHDSEQQVFIQLRGCRAISYQNQSPQGVLIERYPMLRVLWQPDLTKLQLNQDEAFTKCLAKAATTIDGDIDSNKQGIMATLNLLAHKNPSMRILELRNESSPVSDELVELLRPEETIKRCQILTQAHVAHNNDIIVDKSYPESVKIQVGNLVEAKGATYDIAVLSERTTLSKDFNHETLEQIRSFLKPSGFLILHSRLSAVCDIERQGFGLVHSVPDDSETVTILARAQRLPADRKGSTESSAGNDLILVESDSKLSLNDVLEAKLCSMTERSVKRIRFSAVTADIITSQSTVISTVELETPLLSSISAEEMRLMKIITDNASILVWITGGNLMAGVGPDFALATGLSRAMMVEQPVLKFLTFGLDDAVSNVDLTVSNIASILNEASHGQTSDFEYLQQDGLVHVSRFLPDKPLNETFRQKQNAEILPLTLQNSTPCRLAIGAPGQFQSIYFEKLDNQETQIEADFVEVNVKAVGLNAKDLYFLHGIVDTERATCSLDYCGVVTRVGDAVRGFSPGDRVIVFAPGHFATIETVPEWACFKLLNSEDFLTISTLPTVYSTALYALDYRAHISPGQSILIHSAAGGMGIAAIQVAQLVGAEIYATVGTDKKRDFLVNNFGLKKQHIFNSRDSSFLQGIMKATNGRGVDIVLNSLTDDLLHDSCKAVAKFGYFIEIGKSDIVNAGKLGMEMFKRSITFSAFDFSELYNSGDPHYQQIHSRLLAEVMSLYRAGKIKAIEPMKVFDVSDIAQAYRSMSLSDRVGKVVVSMENSESMIQVLPPKFNTTFSPEKTYFLVGCLGGLGRSIAKWMISRGAKRFVFLSRSGVDRLPARKLVEDLGAEGAHVTVERGDVSDFGAVTNAVDRIQGPIGGIVQAAMGLDEALFTSMSCEAWHTGVKPKVTGTWNIHNALKGKEQDLDFFLMTSSVNGSVGVATESNYCAANYFLDMFARYRQNLGLPAISIGLGVISEVGYLHENPEIEELLMRKGVHAIDEDELLHIIDAALSSPQGSSATSSDKLSESHILTGLEPLGLDELSKKGFKGTPMTFNDSRASLLASLFSTDATTSHQSGISDGFPAELAAAIESGGPVSAVILQIFVKQFSNLLLVPVEDLNSSKPMSSYGIDSMLAAVIRSWVYQTFKVDVDLMALLSQSATIQSMVEVVGGKLMMRKKA